jgi:hypothetical protein
MWFPFEEEDESPFVGLLPVEAAELLSWKGALLGMRNGAGGESRSMPQTRFTIAALVVGFTIASLIILSAVAMGAVTGT